MRIEYSINQRIHWSIRTVEISIWIQYAFAKCSKIRKISREKKYHNNSDKVMKFCMHRRLSCSRREQFPWLSTEPNKCAFYLNFQVALNHLLNKNLEEMPLVW